MYKKERHGTSLIGMRLLRLLVRQNCSKRLWEDRVHILVDRWETTEPPTSGTEQDLLKEFIVQEGLLAFAEEILTTHDIKPEKLDALEAKKKLEKLTAFALVSEDKRVLAFSKCDPKSLFITGKAAGRVPTGFKTLDMVLDGGHGRGEYGLVVAPPNAGKTAMLLELGQCAMLSGLEWVHVSLEIKNTDILERIMMGILGKTTKEIRNNPALKRKALNIIKKSGGDLHTFDFSDEDIGLSRIDNILMQHPNAGFLTIDYVDLLKGGDDRIAIGKIHRSVRRMASFHSIPTWSAAQGNRESMKLISEGKEFGLEHVAEDISKGHTIDTAICFMQTDVELRNNRARIKVVKGRKSPERPTFPVSVDFWRMQWSEGITDGGTDVDSETVQRAGSKGRKLDRTGAGRKGSKRGRAC